jgi:calcium-dependent protein kinase
VREGGSASDRPLEGTVVQRLQRHATYGHFKQLVLHMIAEDVITETDHEAVDMLRALRCGARPAWREAVPCEGM